MNLKRCFLLFLCCLFLISPVRSLAYDNIEFDKYERVDSVSGSAIMMNIMPMSISNDITWDKIIYFNDDYAAVSSQNPWTIKMSEYPNKTYVKRIITRINGDFKANNTYDVTLRWTFSNIEKIKNYKSFNYVIKYPNENYWEYFTNENVEFRIMNNVLIIKFSFIPYVDSNGISFDYHGNFVFDSLEWSQEVNIDGIGIVKDKDYTGFFGTIIGWIKGIFDSIVELPQRIANSIKSFFDMIVSTINKAVTSILDGIKALFIPRDGYFKTLTDDLYSFFDERLGLFMVIFDVVNGALDIFISAGKTDAIFSIPSFSIMGYELLPVMNVNLTQQLNQFGDIVGYIHILTSIVLIGGFVNMLYYKYKGVVEN